MAAELARHALEADAGKPDKNGDWVDQNDLQVIGDSISGCVRAE